MERVKIGEKYWYLSLFSGKIRVEDDIEHEDEKDRVEPLIDKERFLLGNYFHTKEEAESMAEKIRKVLQGADVIEVPSKPLGLTDIKNHHLRGYVPERLSINDLKAFALGFWEGCDWLASKIVK